MPETKVEYRWRYPSPDELDAMMTPEMKAVQAELARIVQRRWDALFEGVPARREPATWPRRREFGAIRFDVT